MRRFLLMVIGFALEDGERPVQLFCKNRSYHLVGEGHLGERHLGVGPGIDLGRKAVRPADDEDQPFPAPGELPADPVRPFDRAVLGSMLIQEDDRIRRKKARDRDAR